MATVAWRLSASFYRRARLSGFWDRILNYLVKLSRKKAGKNTEPTYAIIDSQSVKTSSFNEQRGFDAHAIL